MKRITTKDRLQAKGFGYIAECFQGVKQGDEQYALVLINIKNFRFYNTKFGADSGDEILDMILECLTVFLEDKEYCGYLYADNFAVLMKYEDTTQLVYERMMQLFDRVYRIQDDRIYRNIFFSMGIYCICDTKISFQEAINLANISRKECSTLQNRSHCLEVYDKNFYESYMSRMLLEERTANAYKNYEFTTFLQPKVDLKTEQIVGAEALLRWFDENGNNIPLYTFLPILNANSYIELVDLDVFEQMCQYLDKRIKSKQKVVPISFNISKAYFYDPNMIQDYIRVFEKYEIPKELIEMELMESISLNDTEHMKKVIKGFKDYGFTCALDDFGNGYSSFTVLLNADLDVVKMDRQFFLSNTNGDAKHIIKTVVELLHSLHLSVVAEGVELEEHIQCLKECNCDYVQGYYYYKPMSIADFDVLMDKN